MATFWAYWLAKRPLAPPGPFTGAKILNSKSNDTPQCNYWNVENCPIMGECNQTNVVYQADVHASNKIMMYYHSTKNFKARYSNHKSALSKRPTNHTTLSSYVWKIKDQNVPYSIIWSIKSRPHPFSIGGNACDLCLTEKMVILTKDQSKMLNKHNKLLESCWHRREHLLFSVKIPHIDTS